MHTSTLTWTLLIDQFADVLAGAKVVLPKVSELVGSMIGSVIVSTSSSSIVREHKELEASCSD